MRRALWMMLAGAGGLALGAAAAQATDALAGRAQIEQVVHDYILAHPEIIPEAMARLRTQETGKLLAADRQALETPFAGAWAGNAQGDVTLVMFTDYACVYCRASAPEIDRLLREDPRLKVVWREIPVLGPASEVAARTALAAARQGKYLPFHRALFADARPDGARLNAAIRTAGLDPARIAADRDATTVADEIDNNLAIARRIGVDGTPAFVVGDQMLSGAVGHDKLAAAIAATREARRSGSLQ